MKRAAVAFTAALACMVPKAAAAATVLPAPSGELGAWLVAGPLPARGSLERIEMRAGGRVGDGNFPARLRAFADTGPLDLKKRLAPRPGSRAVLGGILTLERRLDGWLLFSVDGGVRVRVAGNVAFERATARLRGQSWDAIRVELDEGAHPLVFELTYTGERWGFEARILDRRRLLAPDGLTLGLPESDTDLVSRRLTEVSLEPGLSVDGYRPRLLVRHPRGAERSTLGPIRATLSVAGRPLPEVHVGDFSRGRGVAPVEAQLPSLPPEALGSSGAAQPLSAAVNIGERKLETRTTVSAGAPQALRRAVDLRNEIVGGRLSHLADPNAIRSTLDWSSNRLTEARTSRQLADSLDALERLVDDVVDGDDPVHDRTGVNLVALDSELDGRPQPMAVHVPAGYSKKAKRKYPLVVVLHGYRGTPTSVTRAFLDTPSRSPALGGFLLAPAAHGDAFYRGPGETNVIDTIEWMLATYPIDPKRVSITGVSMGGTGAAHVAFRHADRFSAASPLCGYHSYFVRRDTQQRARRPWEVERMHHWSTSSWAENGRNLPLYVAHGKRDHPLANSRSLVNRYRDLGYSVTAEWPDTGHSVWEETWRGARMWRWLSSQQRPRAPLRVTIRTDSLRYGQQYWAKITDFQAWGQKAELDAELGGPRHVVVKTSNVGAFEIERPSPRVKPNHSLSIRADGQELGFGPSERVQLHRVDGRWQKGVPKPRPGRKRRGVEGPLRDAFLDRVVVVYGSLDPSTTRANREVGHVLSKMRVSADVEYPVVRDVELDPARAAGANLLLVGTEQDHVWLRRNGSKLPVRVEAGAVVAGSRRFGGPGTGAAFVAPNPTAPDRYVVVITATDVEGTYRALSLPALLPDFVIFDGELAAAAGQQLLGEARVLAGGFFNDDWTLPDPLDDPERSAAESKDASASPAPSAAEP